MIAKRRSARRDPLESVIQDAFWSEEGIDYSAGWSLVPDFEDIAKQIGKLVRTDPMRAARLYEAFLAGCYDKAEDFESTHTLTSISPIFYRFILPKLDF